MQSSKLAALAAALCLLSACQQSSNNNMAGAGTNKNAPAFGTPAPGTAGTAAAAAPATTPLLPPPTAPNAAPAAPVAPAPAGGALLGPALSNGLGKMLDSNDRVAYDAASQHVLETGQPGQTMPWRNPQSGNSGTITAQNYYQNPAGQYCRQFIQTIVVGTQKQDGSGQACRLPSGTWQLIQ